MEVSRTTLAREVDEILEDLKPGEAERIVYTMFNSMAKALQEGQSIKIRGFGIIEVVQRAPRKRYSYVPSFGKPWKKGCKGSLLDYPAKKNVIFKASKTLKKMLKEEPYARS